MQRDIIAIGGSLGAVSAIGRLCAAFSPDLAARVCIVLHVGSMGNDLLADIFDQQSGIPVSTAVDGQELRPGHAYVAPADRHLLVLDGVLRLGQGPRENMARPAIDPLFRSVGMSYGPRAIGVVLTGRLNDGAAGLADLKICGGIGVVQSPTDAEAPEMPLGALRSSDVDYRAPLEGLAPLLQTLTLQEAEAAPEVPERIRLEVGIALGLRAGAERTARFADPVPLSCPACGGVLSQVRQPSPLRFRCQTGHAYTADVLNTEQTGSVDEAIRVALRIVEERAVLTEKMAEEASRTGRPAAAAICEARAKEYRAHEEVLRMAGLRKP